MRDPIRSTRLRLWLGPLVVGSLLLVPTAWASGEDVRETGAPTKSEPEQARADANDETADAAAKPDPESATPKAEPPTPTPGFSTLEDIAAHLGPPEALWQPRSSPAVSVAWRETEPVSPRD